MHILYTHNQIQYRFFYFQFGIYFKVPPVNLHVVGTLKWVDLLVIVYYGKNACRIREGSYFHYLINQMFQLD